MPKTETTKATEPPKEDKSEKNENKWVNQTEEEAKIPVPPLPRSDFVYTYCFCEENIYKLVEKLALRQLMSKAKGEAPQFDLIYVGVLSNFRQLRKYEKVNDWKSIVPVRVSPGDKDDPEVTILGKDCCNTWDYHVIAVVRTTATEKQPAEWYVADFDTRHTSILGKGFILIPLAEYTRKSFEFLDLLDQPRRTSRMNPKKMQAAIKDVYMRIMHARDYLTYLRSDRSHMLKHGKYQSPPPEYNAITAPSPIGLKLRAADGITEPVTPIRPDFSNNLVSIINMETETAPAGLGVVVPIGEVVSYFKNMSP